MPREAGTPATRAGRGARTHGFGPALLVLIAIGLSAGEEAHAQLLDKVLGGAEKAKEVAGKAKNALPIGTEEEVSIGRGVAATLAGHYTLDRDEALTEYVNLVGLAVAAVDPRSDIDYRFGVLASDEVNALAAPGGYVFVTRGALALMQDEAELAGVLAHEVGHVNERHVVSEIQKRARTTLGAEVAQEALKADEELLDKVVGLGTNVLMLGLSREDELEADSLGVVYAAAAGYDPGGLLRFVQKLEKNEDRPFLATFKATHPKPADRVKLIQRVAAKAGSGEAAGRTQLAERFRGATSSAQ